MLNIFDQLKRHFSFFENLSEDVLVEFCRISVEFITNGVNNKLYTSAAQKLEVETETVQNAVQGLMQILIDGSKLMLSEVDLHDSLLLMGLSAEKCAHIVTCYTENHSHIRSVLARLASSPPSYFDLEWRLDVQLASRSLRHQLTPQLLLRLHTEEANGEQIATLLQTDPTTLVHLSQSLDQALSELKSTHCRRLMRHL